MKTIKTPPRRRQTLMRETSPRKTPTGQNDSANNFDQILGFTIPRTETARDGHERRQPEPAAHRPWRNPTQLERPAFLLNFPFSYSTERPNNPWMQDLSTDRRQPDFKRAAVQFLELYRALSAEALVYLLPTPRDAELQDLMYTANLGIVLDHAPGRNTVVISNFTSEPRRDEAEIGIEFFRSMGYEVHVPETKFEGEAELKKQYKELLRYSRQVLNDTKRVIAEVEQMPAKKKKELRGMCEHLSVMAGRVRQVVKQTKTRIFDGITQLPGKIVSLFEPHSEIIRKGKASKPTEFGKMIQVQETENQIITHYDVFDQRPSDRDLLSGAVETHQRVLGRVPNLATADAGYYSRAQEQAVEEKGVKWVAVPNRNTKSAERKKKEHSHWFKKAQAWRTGCEGRISVLKRRHGLTRCRYHGVEGMKRWVGLGVMADTLISMGNVLAARA